MKVSDCCGAPPKYDSDDRGICISCGEHCEYVDYVDEDAPIESEEDDN